MTVGVFMERSRLVAHEAFCFGESRQHAVTEPRDALIGSYPQRAASILEQGGDAVMSQALCCRVAGEAITVPLDQAASGTNPERAMSILQQHPGGSVRKSGSSRVASEAITLPVSESFVGTHPEPAGPVLVQAGDTVGWQSIGEPIRRETPVRILVQATTPGANPDRARAILKNWIGSIERQPLPFGVQSEKVVSKSLKSVLNGADPGGTLAIDVERAASEADAFVRPVPDPVRRSLASFEEPDAPSSVTVETVRRARCRAGHPGPSAAQSGHLKH